MNRLRPDRDTGLGYLAIAVFILAYVLVVTEEMTGLRKSKPLVVAAGLIWLIVAIAWKQARLCGSPMRFATIFWNMQSCSSSCSPP